MSASRHPRAAAAGVKSAVPPLTLAQLRWRLASYRMSAIKGIEACVVHVAGLRRQLDDPALDAILDGFRAVHAELRAIDPDGPIDPAELAALVERLTALQSAVGTVGAA